ncbi:nuclear transport factor 2 family protein [Cryptosporangium sp. NPDC051539]|uniref:nuclear transport factor 2 family protein n=1 Tax=Cryptosporangium sp. NPDC051539 TaxID=3363962 RepID=UPI0037AE5D43
MDTALRLARVEARLEIGQLPIRYALAVDSRDLDAWCALFVPDVHLGRHGQGREALLAYITPQVRWFYRSVHQICGHRIVLGPDETDGPRTEGGPSTATGNVYCRAEHEVGDRWIVMAIRYDDMYRKVEGDWLFERRAEHHWYATDVAERPQAVGFDSWGTSGHPPALPGADPSWTRFWTGTETGDITSAP